MKKLLSILLTIALAGSLASCAAGGNSGGSSPAGDSASTAPSGSSVDEKDLPVLRVAVMPYVTSLSTKYIIDNGWDVKNGFKIETVMFSIGAPMNEALGANLWDVGTVGGAAVTGVASYDALIIADLLEANNGIALFARPDSEIAKVKGFNPTYPELYGSPDTVRGADILLSVGSINQLNELKWLEKIGVKDDEVSTVNMDVPQAYQAFLAGEGDVVGLNPPFSFNAVENGWVNVGGLKELDIPFVDMLMCNKRSIPKKEEYIATFVRLIYEANAELQKDPDMAEKMLAEYFKENGSEVSAEAVRQDIERIQFLTKEDMKTREMGQFIKMMAEFMAGIGKIETDKLPLFETNVVDKYVQQAIGS